MTPEDRQRVKPILDSGLQKDSTLVVEFRDLRRPVVTNWAFWWGMTPDDALLTMRDLGTPEIYAFDVLP